MPSFTPLTSADWLAKHGLKGIARLLSLELVNICVTAEVKNNLFDTSERCDLESPPSLGSHSEADANSAIGCT